MGYLIQPILSIEEAGLKLAGNEVYTTKTNKRQLESLKRQLNTLEQNTKLVFKKNDTILVFTTPPKTKNQTDQRILEN